MNSEIQKVLSSNEKIIWEGKPQKTPYIILNLGYTFFMFVVLSTITRDSSTGQYDEVSPVSLLIGFTLFIIAFIVMILNYNKIYYAITDKRLILQKGLIGRDFESIDFDKINSIAVNVGILDKLFGKNSGTILLDSGKLTTTKDIDGKYSTKTDFHKLQFIDDAYNVYEKLKKVSTDVKSDINFPNALRPNKNPGYKTENK